MPWQSRVAMKAGSDAAARCCRAACRGIAERLLWRRAASALACVTPHTHAHARTRMHARTCIHATHARTRTCRHTHTADNTLMLRGARDSFSSRSRHSDTSFESPPCHLLITILPPPPPSLPPLPPPGVCHHPWHHSARSCAAPTTRSCPSWSRPSARAGSSRRSSRSGPSRERERQWKDWRETGDRERKSLWEDEGSGAWGEVSLSFFLSLPLSLNRSLGFSRARRSTT